MKLIIEKSPTPTAGHETFGICLKRSESNLEHITDRYTLAEAQALVAELTEVGQNYSMGEAIADLACFFAGAAWHPGDSRELNRLCIEWAVEFEKKWAGHNWGVEGLPDGSFPDYCEEINKFYDVKYADWPKNGIGSDTHRSPHSELIDLLSRALPFVEDAVMDPAYKKGVVGQLAESLRSTIKNTQD